MHSKGVRFCLSLLAGGLLLSLVGMAGCQGASQDKGDDVLTFAMTPSAPTPTIAPLMPQPSVQALQDATPAQTQTQAPDSSPYVGQMPDNAVQDSPVPSMTPAVEKTYIAEGFYYQPLDDALKNRITGMSYPALGEEVRIAYADLRYISLLHVDFEGNEHTGELIVHRKVAKEVTEIFYTLYQQKYPLASVRLVDDYGEPGDDNKSMAANNTSAFNYRRVTGSKTLSRHSYGAAIDINPLFNPYLDGERVAPPAAAPYVDRSKDFPGKIDHDDMCYRLFTAAGWSWGGDFKGDKDYQHFSKDVGY